MPQHPGPGDNKVGPLSLKLRFYPAMVVAIIVCVIFYRLGRNGSPWFLAAWFALTVAVTIYVWTLRCPSCRKPVTIIRGNIFLPWIPEKCRNCGQSLT